jgi:hypothetical protein
LLDHFIGTLLELKRDIEAERRGGSEIDHQLELAAHVVKMPRLTRCGP